MSTFDVLYSLRGGNRLSSAASTAVNTGLVVYSSFFLRLLHPFALYGTHWHCAAHIPLFRHVFNLIGHLIFCFIALYYYSAPF